MKKSILLLLLALTTMAMAQNHSVKGLLFDDKTGEPIPFANAALYRTSDTSFMRGGTTDIEGHFTIPDVANGEYLMMISVVGYQDWNKTLSVKSDLDLGTLRLSAGEMLMEVKVVGERPLFSMDGEKNIYHTTDDPSIQTGSASDALQNAPGIEIDADGNITLRGTQSVEVWINDRPSHMEGEALKQYIKMLPANSIEKIEVISNPSARYGGGTPVVNIITTSKINRNEFVSFGLNGSSRPDQNIWLSDVKPWVSYVYANEKFNFNIYANFGYSKRESEYHSSSVMYNEKLDTARVNSYTSTEANKGLDSYIGGDLNYTFDSLNSLGCWYGLYPEWHDRNEWGRSERYDYFYDTDGNKTIVDNTYEGTEAHPNTFSGGGYFGGWYEHKFDDSTGHKINLSVNANGYYSPDQEHHERHYTVLTQNDLVRDVESTYNHFNMGLSADYVLPFGKQDTLHRFNNELSIGTSLNHSSDYSYNVSTWTSPGFLLGKTDSIDKDNLDLDNSYSLYTTYQRRWGNFTAKLGLRGEADHYSIDYRKRPAYSKDTTYLTLTPSIHLSYSTPSMHNFSFSYTRRVSNPDIEDVTCYREYGIDNYGTWGNPDLLPSYSQKIELQWDKYFTKFGSIGAQLYYSGTTNEESELASVTWSDFYGATVSYTQPMNIGDSYNAGLDLNVTYRPNAFVNIRFNGSIRYNNEDFTFQGQHYLNQQWSYTVRLNAWAKLWKNYQFFVNANYGSPTKSIFTTTDAMKGVDLGVNADFFDKKMTVNLNVHDIFNINAWSTSNDNPYYTSSGSWKPMSRYITLGITFRFGKMELASMANEQQASSASGSR